MLNIDRDFIEAAGVAVKSITFFVLRALGIGERGST